MVTHEVTYESLPFATRARLHEQLARYSGKTDFHWAMAEALWLDTLVYHYVRTENRAKQRQYLLKAGQAALEASAYSTAWEYLARLLELTPPMTPAARRWRCNWRKPLQPERLPRRARRHPASTSRRDHGRRPRRRAGVVGRDDESMGDYAAAQTILAEAVPLARACGDPQLLSRALYALGDVGWRLGTCG